MTFSEYLIKNRIKEDEFAAGDPNRYANWQRMFDEMHVNSFYISVKMVLNDVRNAYHLKEVPKIEKPASTETANRPVVRRAAAHGSATQPASEAAQHDQPPAAEPDLKANRAAIPGRRAVIRKIVAESQENTVEPASEAKTEPATADNTATIAENSASEEASATRPVRSRPVFKRPASVNPEAENSEQPKPADPNEKTESTPINTAPKPGRARPVFKRPDVPSSSETSAVTPEAEAKSESLNPENEAEPAVKPAARPRPIFKRPDVTAQSAAPLAEQNKENLEPAEAKNEAVSTQYTEEPKPASPRPRPVFKRPETTASKPSETESSVTQPEPAGAKNVPISEKNPTSVTPTEPENEAPKPKPPRPRPIFKRPSSNTEPPASASPAE